MAKKSKILQLKIDITKKYMREAGFIPENFSNRQIEEIAKATFKGANNKELKSFGSVAVIENGQLVWKKIEGQIRKRQMEQIQLATADRLYDNNGDPKQTFGQIIADQNVREAYGYDIFKFIEENNIQNYDISQGTYYDPKTGQLKSFIQ